MPNQDLHSRLAPLRQLHTSTASLAEPDVAAALGVLAITKDAATTAVLTRHAVARDNASLVRRLVNFGDAQVEKCVLSVIQQLLDHQPSVALAGPPYHLLRMLCAKATCFDDACSRLATACMDQCMQAGALRARLPCNTAATAVAIPAVLTHCFHVLLAVPSDRVQSLYARVTAGLPDHRCHRLLPAMDAWLMPDGAAMIVFLLGLFHRSPAVRHWAVLRLRQQVPRCM